MPETNRPTPGFPSVRRVLGSALEITQSRLELLGIELTEEKERLLTVVFLGLAAMLLGLLALITLTALIAAVFWETYRWQALGAIALVYVLAAWFCAAKVQRILRDAPLPFEATLGEFEKDRDALRNDQPGE